MSTEQLPALLLSILAVGYTPGPANIYAMSCSVRYGLRPAMRVWVGLLCGFCCAALLAALAAHLAGMAFGAYVPYIRYVAVAYILYLAWKTYRGGISDTAATAPTFASGFIVQFTNAKIILFDLSCYSLFVLPYSDRFIDLLQGRPPSPRRPWSQPRLASRRFRHPPFRHRTSPDRFNHNVPPPRRLRRCHTVHVTTSLLCGGCSRGRGAGSWRRRCGRRRAMG